MLALAAAGLVAAAPSGSAQTTQRAQRVPTAFALASSGYGTRLHGGQIPANSKDTAWDVIGCNNNAGISHGNTELGTTDLVDGLRASAIKTHVWTTKKGDVVSSHASNTIAHVTLANSQLGSLSIDGLKAASRAYHDGSGFHAVTKTTASITYSVAGSDPQTQELPPVGQPLVIPGVATITTGKSVESKASDHATAVSEVLTVQVAGSQTKVHLGHAYARIDGGIRSGVFGGFGSGVRGKGIDGHITVGRTPYGPMPCQGTGGTPRTKSIASSDLGGQIVVSGVNTKQNASATMRKATGFEQGSVAELNIGGGQLVVKGIVGRANVTRKGAGLNTLVRNIKGSTVGSITAGGQKQTFPATGALEIPGVAKLQRNVKKKINGGITVVALRVTLLGGANQGAVLDLGQAKLTIHKSGL
jgi:hypothetical protein